MAFEAFGQKMLRMREAKGVTRYALAKLRGLTQKGMARLEKEDRDPAWQTVRRVAKALGVACLAFAGRGSRRQGHAEEEGGK